MRRRRRSPAGEMLGVHGAASSVMPLTMLTTAETPGHTLDAAPPIGGARCRPLRRFDLQRFHRVGEAFGAIALVLADVTADAATEARRVAALFALGLFARRLPLLFALPGLNRAEQLDEAFDDRHPPKASTRRRAEGQPLRASSPSGRSRRPCRGVVPAWSRRRSPSHGASGSASRRGWTP